VPALWIGFGVSRTSSIQVIVPIFVQFSRGSAKPKGQSPHLGFEMNVFRLIGDLLHLFSIVVLLLKIYTTKKCNGVAWVDSFVFGV
jgi:hypothetical protein